MELDNLKTIWKEQKIPAGDDQHDAEMLVSLLQERSRGPIERMRRNTRKESLLMLVTYIPTIAIYLIMFQGRLWGISLVMAVILVFYRVYYYLKLRLLKKMQCVSCEVRSNLARQIDVLGKYVRFYYWSSTILLLSALILAYEILRYSYREVHPRPTPVWWFQPGFLLVLLGPFALAAWYFNRKYVNKLYGRHIKKLKQLLLEMDEV
jgi:hypothetical protein